MHEEKIKKLISLVSQCKVLYDKNDAKYNDLGVRDKIWAGIGREIKADAKACKLKWKALRDGLRRTQKANCATDKTTNWRYWDAMSFLLPHVKGPTLFPDFKANEDEEESNNELLEAKREFEESESDDNVEDNKSSSSNNLQPATSESSAQNGLLVSRRNKATTRKPESSSELTEEYASDKKPIHLGSEIETTNYINDETNEILEFFINMGKTVVRFPPLWQAIMKSRVFQIVNSAEMELLNGACQETQIPMHTLTPSQNRHVNLPPSINTISSSYNPTAKTLPFMPPPPGYYPTFIPPLPYTQHTSHQNIVLQTQNIQPAITKETTSLSKKKYPRY